MLDRSSYQRFVTAVTRLLVLLATVRVVGQSNALAAGSKAVDLLAVPGANAVSVVRIVDEILPWIPAYPNPATETDALKVLRLLRVDALNQAVSVSYMTRDGSARAGFDYVATNGVVEFQPGQYRAEIRVALLDNGEQNLPRQFHVELAPVSPGSIAEPADTALISIFDNEMPASVDAGFVAPFAPRNTVGAIHVEPDDSLLVGGAHGLVRLRPDGSFAHSFTMSPEYPAAVAQIAKQRDGRIIALLRGLGEIPWGRIVVRFWPDGSPDPTFRPFTPGDYIFRLGLLPDDRVLIDTRTGLIRLNPDGTVDSSFPLLAGKGFALVYGNGDALIGDWSVRAIKPPLGRLKPDGTISEAFRTVTHGITFAVEQSDGKVIIESSFNAPDGGTGLTFARFHPDGSLDPTFDARGLWDYPSSMNTVPSGEVDALSLDSKGRLLVSYRLTDFGRWLVVGRLLRLNLDGTLDTTFDSGLVYAHERGDGVNRRWKGPIQTIGFQTDGSIVAGGFVSLANGWHRHGLLRFRPHTQGVQSVDFVANEFSGGENANTGQVILRRVGDVSRPASVRLNASAESASEGKDFLPLSTTVHFPALVTNQTVSVAILNDTRYERDETVQLQLEPEMAGVVVGGTNATLRIVDDEQPGSLDFSFLPFSLVPYYLSLVALQSDGKLLVRENFSTSAEQPIIRLAPDGSKDPSFSPLPAANYLTVVPRPGGKFFALTAQSPWLVSLNSDGSLDPSFRPETDDIARINTILPQRDGKVVLWASLSSGLSRMVRLLADGSRDTAFTSAYGAAIDVRVMTLTSRDEILIGGYFDQIQGTPRPGVARLRADGNLDLAFNPREIVSQSVAALSADSLGRVVASGEFRLAQSTNLATLVRLLPDGRIDPTFRGPTPFVGLSGLSAAPVALLPLDDGRLLAGGGFTHVGDVQKVGLVRLHPDGSVDQSFGPTRGVWNNYGSLIQYVGEITTIAPWNDGQILVSGGFNWFDGIVRPGIARVNGDTVHRFAATVASADGSVRMTLTGRPGYTQIIETSEDLKSWAPLSTNVAAPATIEIIHRETGKPQRYFRARRE